VPVLILKAVSKSFGVKKALDAVSLDVEPGQFVSVIGPSGAGKSTLLRCINRLSDPDQGEILFEGRNVLKYRGRDLRAWRAKAAMIFQQFNLVPRLDVVTNVLLGRLAHRPVWPSLFKSFTVAERAMAIAILDRLNLAEAAFQRAETLSGGQQQRVAIARALMQEPALMLADEPVASLDPANAEAVLDTLKAIAREDRIPVLCNIHALDMARAYSDRIVAMRNGRIVFDGPPGALTPEAAETVYGETPPQ
jgi:phosphonate transport system ATP-binding protein